jgi:hypothetical protein
MPRLLSDEISPVNPFNLYGVSQYGHFVFVLSIGAPQFMQLRIIPQPLPFHGIPCKPIQNFRNDILYQTAMLSHVLALSPRI